LEFQILGIYLSFLRFVFCHFFLQKNSKLTPYFIYIYLDNLNFLLFILVLDKLLFKQENHHQLEMLAGDQAGFSFFKPPDSPIPCLTSGFKKFMEKKELGLFCLS